MSPPAPTKTVTLKIKVADEDLVRGKYRQQEETETAQKKKRTYRKRKATFSSYRQKKERARKRRRGEGVDVDDKEEWGVVEEAGREGWEEDWDGHEEEVEQQQQKEREPGLEDFCLLSPYSFPVLMPRGEAQVTSLPDRTRVSRERECVCCGEVEGVLDREPGDENVVKSIEDGHSINNLVPVESANVGETPSTPLPWERLNLQPIRHVNQETNSVTDLVITRTGPVPNTVGFWYDVTVAEQAKASDDIDFKMMCLNLVRWRDWNDVPSTPTTPSFDAGRRGVLLPLWDTICQEAAALGKAWRKRRRRKEKQARKAAGWAVWEERMRRDSRDGFEKDDVGAWVVRAAGDDGEILKVLKLGYRRRKGKTRALAKPGGEAMHESRPATVLKIRRMAELLSQTGRLDECAIFDDVTADDSDPNMDVDGPNFGGLDEMHLD